MLTKTKNIRKKIFFFQKLKKRPSIWPRGSRNQNWKEIHAFGTEIIVTRTDDERMDEQTMDGWMDGWMDESGL